MATERWHGRTQHIARMGEVSEAVKRNNTEYLRASLCDSRETGSGEIGPQKRTSSVHHHQQEQLCSAADVSILGFIQMMLIAVLLLVRPSDAAFINFDNCLSLDIINSNPLTLQFQPIYVWATFNSSAASHNINVTTYGNVAGIATQQPYPDWTDPQWKDPNKTVGKIPDVGGQGNQQKFTTFTTQLSILDYTPYNPPAVRFCNTSALTQCPMGPVFNFTDDS